jgi:hypothetical protein
MREFLARDKMGKSDIEEIFKKYGFGVDDSFGWKDWLSESFKSTSMLIFRGILLESFQSVPIQDNEAILKSFSSAIGFENLSHEQRNTLNTFTGRNHQILR